MVYSIIGGSCHKVSFLSRQKFCPEKHVKKKKEKEKEKKRIKTHFCSDKTFNATNIILLRQNVCHVFCDDEIMLVATKLIFCRDKHNFAATNVLSRQEYFFATKVVFCRGKHVFVATKVSLSRQK